jgi:hypothetical protein
MKGHLKDKTVGDLKYHNNERFEIHLWINLLTRKITNSLKKMKERTTEGEIYEIFL